MKGAPGFMAHTWPLIYRTPFTFMFCYHLELYSLNYPVAFVQHRNCLKSAHAVFKLFLKEQRYSSQAYEDASGFKETH